MKKQLEQLEEDIIIINNNINNINNNAISKRYSASFDIIN
jgi:hypothetical protein